MTWKNTHPVVRQTKFPAYLLNGASTSALFVNKFYLAEKYKEKLNEEIFYQQPYQQFLRV